MEMDEVLWLARCLYSEADRANEQRLVAWVVRNRVETGFRGRNYRDVVLEKKQFSAFNEPSARRTEILGFNQNTVSAPWRQALGIALDVYKAPASERPFSIETRHFYSPVSMPGGAAPVWAEGDAPVDVAGFGIDPQRFRFFNGVDAGEATMETAGSHFAGAEERIEERRAASTTRIRHRFSSRLIGKVARPVRPSVSRTSAER